MNAPARGFGFGDLNDPVKRCAVEIRHIYGDLSHIPVLKHNAHSLYAVETAA